MKVVILSNKQKTQNGIEASMLRINGKPILYYVITHFLKSGYDDFIMTVPKGESRIKEYLNILADTQNGYILDEKNVYFEKIAKKFRIQTVERECNEDTSKTLDFISKYIGENAFIFTYGDILPCIDVEKTVEFHKESGNVATISAYQLPSLQRWINTGTMIFENEALDYIDKKDRSFEQDTLKRIAEDGEIGICKINTPKIQTV
ncbi:MAG: hypothetical protein IJZ93_02465 [Clostridia bacterium]|nr:hypothetical protein [Clostridia bacterium]